jgi:hypothetical protein
MSSRLLDAFFFADFFASFLAFGNWQLFSVSHKINWICNCEKHYDGFPKKIPKPFGCEHYPENKRLELTVTDFKNDCEKLLDKCPIYLTMYLTIAQLKNFDDTLEPDLWDDELGQTQINKIRESEQKMFDAIEKLKKVARGDFKDFD